MLAIWCLFVSWSLEFPCFRSVLPPGPRRIIQRETLTEYGGDCAADRSLLGNWPHIADESSRSRLCRISFHVDGRRKPVTKRVHRIRKAVTTAQIPARAAATRANGSWVVTWSIKSAPHASDERIIVSDMGEHWSPNIEPPTTAPKQSMPYIGSVDIDQARGIASGNMTANVPNEVPIEKETSMQIKSSRVG